MRRHSLRSLTKRRDFESVFKEGVSSASKNLVMYAKPNDLGWNRLGLSVSKKIGRAVTRNRIKRLLREAMRKALEEFFLNYDFVLIAKRSSVEGDLNNFIREIERLLSRLSHEKDSDIDHKTL